MLNVKDFGALGNGTHPDGPAIQSAIAAAVAAGGGTVYFPTGRYSIDSAIPMPVGVSYLGDGMECSIIEAAAGLTQMFVQNNAVVQQTKSTVSDLMIYGNGTATRGVVMTKAYYVHFNRVQVKGFSSAGGIGISLTECLFTVLFGCFFSDCHTGHLVLDKTVVSGCNQSQVRACEFDATNRPSCRALVVTGQGIVIRDNDFEGGGSGDIAIDLRDTEGVFVQSNYIERWLGKAITCENAVGNVRRLVVENNVIHSGPTSTNICDLNHISTTPTNIIFRSNRFADNTASQTCVHVGNATRVWVYDNDPDVARLTENYSPAAIGPDVGTLLAGSTNKLPKRNATGVLADSQLSDDGTTVSSAGMLSLAKSLIFNGLISPPNITANQHNYEPTGFLNATTVRISANAGLQITGFGRDANPHVKLLMNVGTNNITLVHESASSVANKRLNLAGAANRTLAFGSTVLLVYDGTSDRWRLVG